MTYLTEDEVAALSEGTPITVTWTGGNGPHDYVVTVDGRGIRFATQPEHIGTPMQFYNALDFVGAERFHTRVSLR
jgi:sensor histidine kinase regulating citrate/malate metabolism